MVPDLQPMTAAELLDRTFSIYRKHFPLFVGIVAVPMLAHFLANVVYTGIFPPPSPEIGEIIRAISRPERLVLNVINLLALLFAQGATVIAVSDVYLGHPSGIGKSFACLRGNLLNILFAMIFMGIAIFFGFMFLIVPGIIFMTGFALTVPATVIENRTPIDAMKRSWELTKEGRWRVLTVLIVVGILTYIVSILFAVPSLIIAGISGLRDPSNISVTTRIVEQIGVFLASCLVTPVGVISTSLIYYDQRVRKEGFDLHLMISSLDSKSSESNEAPHTGIF